ncbi:MAG: ATP-dependent DNA helicase [Candidatus Paceibacterota bacterium]
MSGQFNFQTQLNRLNPAQKKAVETIDGPVMVIAGPGTGKTQVLTTRIAQILQITDTEPNSILALTFTESAAKNMRERLVKLIGRTGYYVQISTFHAFCQEIINSHPEYFPIERDSEPLSDLERFKLFETIFDQLPLENIRPINTPYFYVRDAIGSISDLKREGINIKEYEQLIDDWSASLEQQREELSKTAWEKEHKQLLKNQELLQVFEAYEKSLRASKRYDFDDMISLVVEAFEQHELLLREYQENLHYCLVDEYQDTNTAQNTVVDLLVSFWQKETGQPNIFVVGDPNQAIYRFQGASVENMLGFVKRYPTAQVITLETGYRSPQKIYDLASQLISENRLSLKSAGPKIKMDVNLKSPHGAGTPIELSSSSSQVLEAVQIAEQIKSLLEKGVPAHEIAVLYRHNADRSTLAETFDSWEIPYEIEGGGNALQELIIQQLLSLFTIIYQLRDASESELLYEVLHYPWFKEKFSLDPLITMKVARAAGKARTSLFELVGQGVKAINEYNPNHEITAKQLTPLQDCFSKLRVWSELDAQETFTKWFEIVLDESGYLPWLLNQDSKIFLITVLNSVFSEIKKLVAHSRHFKLADFLKAIELIESHNLQITIEDLNVRRQAVHLSTVHKAKGREWEHVFLTRVIDKKWGNNRTRDLIKLPAAILQNTDLSTKERNEDERRLFYVGVTRAKKQVHISYPETLVGENQSRDSVPSMFLTEIQEFDPENKLMKSVEFAEIKNQADQYLAKLLKPTEVLITEDTQKIYLRWVLSHFRWSTTALNTYLKDPEEFLHYNLLRVPRAKALPFAFGTAIHAALEKYYSALQQTGKHLPLVDLQKGFEQTLAKEILTDQEFQDRLKHGKKILEQYYAHYQNETVEPLLVERFFGGGRNKVVLDDILLTGRIDRIDWLDQAKKLVKVVDYKTGKVKSKNEIEGKVGKLSEREQALPENIRGSYKRQLLFYKLLTKLDRTFPYEVVEGEFDFVQPNASGKLVRRNFKLEDQDVQDLANLIKTVVAELKTQWQ